MKNEVFNLKNSLPSLMVVKLFSNDADDITEALRARIRKAPMMLIGMQIVIDISSIDSKDLDLKAIKDCFFNEGINVVAIMTRKKSYKLKAIELKLGALGLMDTAKKKSYHKNLTDKASIEKEQDKKKIENNESKITDLADESIEKLSLVTENKVVQGVRSGQRVYSRGTLTILGTVSPGAEVIADGNIHIYGSLKGRAVAGAVGDKTARIFCTSMDSELISIAGCYKQFEEIEGKYKNKSIQITLENEKIVIFPL